MIYTLFIWTVVAHAHTYNLDMDWRALTTVEAAQAEYDEKVMLAKCQGVARQLNIPAEKYRCVRTR